MARAHCRTGESSVTSGPLPPPGTCPIGWQPSALSPVFFGVRTLGPDDGAPVPVRVFFPSLDGAVETAPILDGCGRYPLVLFCHGHCLGDRDHFTKWFRIPAQLARAGYVVMVPMLAGNAGGSSPSLSGHPDEATLDTVVAWARGSWEHREVLLPPPATGVIGHSFGAMLGARFSVGRPVAAYAGLSGGWQDWFGDEPFPLPLLDLPTLLVWGLGQDLFSPLPNATWQLTMFLGRYLPPELATDLVDRIPATLEPPALDLGFEQEFFAGGYLGGFDALGSHAECAVEVSEAVERLVANTSTLETHSLDHPCPWVDDIAGHHRRVVTARPVGYHWCDFCFRARADG